MFEGWNKVINLVNKKQLLNYKDMLQFNMTYKNSIYKSQNNQKNLQSPHSINNKKNNLLQ